MRPIIMSISSRLYWSTSISNSVFFFAASLLFQVILLRFQSQNNRPYKLAFSKINVINILISMISIGLFAMTSTITQPEKKWITHKTVDSKWYDAKNYLVMSAFQFHDTPPYLIKNGHVQSWTRGPVWQNKTFFSTFMYQGKHADYMQINCFLLIKEKKKRSYQKKGRKLQYYLRLLLCFSKSRRFAL